MIRVICAKQERDILLMHVPNEFAQTKVPQFCKRIIMKIRGALVDMIIEIEP